MHFLELGDAVFRGAVYVGDQLELCLAEIGCDVGMGQGGPQRLGMGFGGQRTVARDAQALFLDASLDVC